jgi:hypothetical protein
LPLRTRELAWARVRWRGRFRTATAPCRDQHAARAALVLLLVIAGWVRAGTCGRRQEIVNGLGKGQDPVSARRAAAVVGASSARSFPGCPAAESVARKTAVQLGQRACLVGTGHCRSPGASPRDRLDQVPATAAGSAIESLIAALGATAKRLAAGDARELATDLVGRLERRGVDGETERTLIFALDATVLRLTESDARDSAAAIRTRLDRPGIDAKTQARLADALGALAGRLTEGDANALADDLRKRLDRPGVEADTQERLLAVLQATAGRLAATDAAKLIADLRTRLDGPELDSRVRYRLIVALGTAAGRLTGADADNAAADLRRRLEQPGMDPATQASLVAALGMTAGGKTEAGAKVWWIMVALLDRPGTASLSTTLPVRDFEESGRNLKDTDAKEMIGYLVARMDRARFRGHDVGCRRCGQISGRTPGRTGYQGADHGFGRSDRSAGCQYLCANQFGECGK